MSSSSSSSALMSGLRSPHLRRALIGASGAAAALVVYRSWLSAKRKRKRTARRSGSNLGRVGGVDAVFIKNLKRLLRIAIPRLRCAETGLLLCQATLLFSRTLVSILVARLDGAIVKGLVSGDKSAFLLNLQWWLVLAIPATTINALIRCLQSRIALAVRTRLTEHVLGRYLNDDTYYKMAQLDSRIQNADQLITVDIERFSSSLSELYSNLAKPFLDLILFGTQLALAVGWVGPVIMGSFYVFYGLSLPIVTPPFGRLAAEEGRLEGQYRFGHASLITNAEEVAFYKGEECEKKMLLERYYHLVEHCRDVIFRRIGFGILEGFMLKYVSSATGLIICAIPVFWSSFGRKSADPAGTHGIGDRTADYTRNRRYLLQLADAITRILSSTKEIGELAGYTARVHGLLETLEDVSNARYVKTISQANKHKMSLFKGGRIEYDDIIQFVDVPVVTPNGDVLVDHLTVTVHPGMHLLITGPNGCGKSSLFRILGGLWPVRHGLLKRPPPKQIFYIPQRPLCSLGTFREQVIYPDSVEDMHRKGIVDDELIEILERSHLRYVLDREGGWDARHDWKDVLSGGEKQRMGMARLFYHKPQFAILDECTSQVSIDVEGLMYTHAKELGISLMTVSHRPSLWKYHDFVLQFDGEGNVALQRLDVNHRMSIEEEKANLVRKLADVPKWEERLLEVQAMLGEAARRHSVDDVTDIADADNGEH